MSCHARLGCLLRPSLAGSATDHALNLLICMALLRGGHALHRSRDRLCMHSTDIQTERVSWLRRFRSCRRCCSSPFASLTVRVLEKL